MTRLLLPALLALTACGGPGLSPDAAYAAHLEAVERRDAEAAYALLDVAADGGHLDALHRQIEAHERGYVPAAPGTGAPHLFVKTPMWRLGAIRRHYDRALRDSAAAGSPTAFLHIAHALTGDLVRSDGHWRSRLAPADRDSVAALYRRLVPTDVPRLQLALLAWHLGGSAAAFDHLDAAVEAAEPTACAFRLMLTDGFATDGSAASFAAFVDRTEACPTPPGAEGMAARDVRALVAERDRGNAASGALLDSLHTLGLFERHPHLGTLVAEAG